MQGNEKHVSLNVYANEIVVYDEIKKKRIATYLKTSLLSVSPISYEAPCTVHFLNADNRLGLRLTDPSTTNSAIIAVTTENKLYIGFKVNGKWLTKLL